MQRVNQYFRGYRSPDWLPPAELAQESGVGGPIVEPTGWVINSNETVVIDEEGIHIEEGAIFLNDESGEVVLTGAGFTGPWDDFIRSGIYNNTFAYGPAPAQITGTDLAHWAVASVGSAATAWHETNAVSGSARNVGLRLSATGGAASDDVYIEQMVAVTNGVPSTYLRPVPSFSIAAIVETQTALPLSFKYVKLRQFKSDGVTSIGADYTGDMAGNSLASLVSAHIPELDPLCAFVRVRVGFRRSTASTSSAGEVNVYSVERINPSPWIDFGNVGYGLGRIRQEAYDFGSMIVIDPAVEDTDYGNKKILTRGEVTGGYEWQEVGTAIAWTNGWQPLGIADYVPVRYYKDPMGFVHFEGVMANGTVGATAFTLPAAYRPRKNLVFAVVSNAAIGDFRILATGAASLSSGSNAGVSLSGITYYAGFSA